MRSREPAWTWEPTERWRAEHPTGPVLAIVGSRKFLNPNAYALAIPVIHSALIVLGPGLVISGGADGMDTFAATLARFVGLPVEEFQPQAPRWEPNGYKERNALMATACTHLLAIRCAASLSYGSGYTADLAEGIGRPVQRFSIPIGGNFVSQSDVTRGDAIVRR